MISNISEKLKNEDYVYKNNKIIQFHKVDSYFDVFNYFTIRQNLKYPLVSQDQITNLVNNLIEHKLNRIKNKYAHIFYFNLRNFNFNERDVFVYVKEIEHGNYYLIIKMKTKKNHNTQRLKIKLYDKAFLEENKIIFCSSFNVIFIQNHKELKRLKDFLSYYFCFISQNEQFEEIINPKVKFKIKDLQLAKVEEFAKTKYEEELFFDVICFRRSPRQKKIVLLLTQFKEVINIVDQDNKDYMKDNEGNKYNHNNSEIENIDKSIHLKSETTIKKRFLNKKKIYAFSDLQKLKKEDKRIIYNEIMKERNFNYTEIKKFINHLESLPYSKVERDYGKLAQIVKYEIDSLTPSIPKNTDLIESYIEIYVQDIIKKIVKNRKTLGFKIERKNLKKFKTKIFYFILIYLRTKLKNNYKNISRLFI